MASVMRGSVRSDRPGERRASSAVRPARRRRPPPRPRDAGGGCARALADARQPLIAHACGTSSGGRWLSGIADDPGAMAVVVARRAMAAWSSRKVPTARRARCDSTRAAPRRATSGPIVGVAQELARRASAHRVHAETARPRTATVAAAGQGSSRRAAAPSRCAGVDELLQLRPAERLRSMPCANTSARQSTLIQSVTARRHAAEQLPASARAPRAGTPAGREGEQPHLAVVRGPASRVARSQREARGRLPERGPQQHARSRASSGQRTPTTGPEPGADAFLLGRGTSGPRATSRPVGERGAKRVGLRHQVRQARPQRACATADVRSRTRCRRRAVSDIEVLDLAGLGRDPVAARLDLLAHELGEVVSASAASSISTRSSVRVAGFMVVSQSCSAFISPRPLKRWMVRFLTFISLTMRSRSFSSRA